MYMLNISQQLEIENSIPTKPLPRQNFKIRTATHNKIFIALIILIYMHQNPG